VLEMSTAIFGASAVLAALRVRRRHGFGQRIDLAIMDTAVNGLVNFLTLHFAGEFATRSGNRHPLNTPWGSYRAKDGCVLICAMTDDHFNRICKAIGHDEPTTDPRFATQEARQRNVEQIDRIVEAWTVTQTVAGCEAVMARVGIPCGPIVGVAALEGERNLAHRRSVVRLPDPLGGASVPIPSSPLRGTPVGGRAPQSIPGRDADRQAILQLLASRAPQPAAANVCGDPRSAAQAMEGIRVVEIGQYTVAPLASRHLGALGAEVIKVESPAGDAVRGAPPFRADGLAYIFALSNTDKQGLVLDLRNEADRARLHRLLDQADVLVENLRQGALGRFGFDQPALALRHPRLVCCSINGFGNDSVYPGRPAFDTVIQAMSGLMSLTSVDGEPMKAGISASDMIGGQFGLLASIAGIEYRERTGKAVQFDISMQDTSVWLTQMDWPGSAERPLSAVIEAGDGYVLAQGDPKLLAPLTDGAAQSLDRAGLVAKLGAAGIESAPVLSVQEVVEHPHSVARKLLVERPTTDRDSWIVLESPLGLRSTPPQVRTAMARLGADDSAVIAKFQLDSVQAETSTRSAQQS
jgi:crotonobetainyl-CoA:carnitine CoA-transferase CaiB-like acyl-CoA transferase